MGSVKYREDDKAINEERMYYKERKDKWKPTYYPEGIDDSVEKLENIYEKNAKAKRVETPPPATVRASTNQTATSSEKKDSKKDVKKPKESADRIKDSNTDFKKPKEYADRIMRCYVCGKEFIFTKADQIEYDRIGKCEPNRCAKCERRKYLPTWIKI